MPVAKSPSAAMVVRSSSYTTAPGEGTGPSSVAGGRGAAKRAASSAALSTSGACFWTRAAHLRPGVRDLGPARPEEVSRSSARRSWHVDVVRRLCGRAHYPRLTEPCSPQVGLDGVARCVQRWSEARTRSEDDCSASRLALSSASSRRFAASSSLRSVEIGVLVEQRVVLVHELSFIAQPHDGRLRLLSRGGPWPLEFASPPSSP